MNLANVLNIINWKAVSRKTTNSSICSHKDKAEIKILFHRDTLIRDEERVVSMAFMTEKFESDESDRGQANTFHRFLRD